MRYLTAAAAVLALSSMGWAEVDSGPKAGDKTAPMTVYFCNGDSKEKDVEVIAERKDKPTIFVFVQAEHFGRPMFRFIKKIDETVAEIGKDSTVVAVWLNEKPDASKEYLPKITQYFNNLTLSVFTGDKSGPKDWGINVDAHVTAVVVNKGKVVKSFGFQSVNEGDSAAVTDVLKKSVGQ